VLFTTVRFRIRRTDAAAGTPLKPLRPVVHCGGQASTPAPKTPCSPHRAY